MDVHVKQIIITRQVPVTVRDRFYQREFTGYDTISMKKYVAIVDGIEWTVEQTYQAMFDGRHCGCNTCVVCDIRKAVYRAEFCY